MPLDGSLRTESVLPVAVRVARAYGAELVLVHLVEELAPTLVLRDDEDLALARRLTARLEANAGSYLGGLRARLARDGVAVRTLVVRHASPRRGILETSVRERADLIVVAAHGAACDAGRMFGSVTEYVLAHATVALLILQDLQETELLAPGHGDEPSPPLRASYTPELA
ncbi:MAG: universal stress protein [Kofleriaceae bacterium]